MKKAKRFTLKISFIKFLSVIQTSRRATTEICEWLKQSLKINRARKCQKGIHIYVYIGPERSMWIENKFPECFSHLKFIWNSTYIHVNSFIFTGTQFWDKSNTNVIWNEIISTVTVAQYTYSSILIFEMKRKMKKKIEIFYKIFTWSENWNEEVIIK